MRSLFVPDYYVNTIYSIDFIKLKSMGIENLIIDIDNTLVPWKTQSPDERVRELVKETRGLGFRICLLSNSSRRRVSRFICDMDVDFFSLGVKPMRIMFLGALKRLGGNPKNTCVIGDQVFTDIFGGNSCGIYTLLVDPMQEKEFLTTKYIRMLERGIRKKLKVERELMKGE